MIFETAVAAARPLSAHLDFLHIQVGAGEAARHTSAEFARGAGLRDALDKLDTKARSFSEVAASNFRDLCMRWQIEMCDTPARRAARNCLLSRRGRRFAGAPDIPCPPLRSHSHGPRQAEARAGAGYARAPGTGLRSSDAGRGDRGAAATHRHDHGVLEGIRQRGSRGRSRDAHPRQGQARGVHQCCGERQSLLLLGAAHDYQIAVAGALSR